MTKSAPLTHLGLSLLALSGAVVIGLGFSQMSQAQAQTPMIRPLPLVDPDTPTATGTLTPLPADAEPLLFTTQDLNANPENIKLTAIPPRLGEEGNLRANPGEKIQTIIRVTNVTETPVTIQSSAEDIIVGEDGVTPLPVTEAVSNRWSMASWIFVSPAQQTIAPRETAQINLVIDVPADALPGGHYAWIMHEPTGAQAELNNTSLVSQRVGTLVYFIVEGPINEEAFIRDIQFPQITEYGPVDFTYKVENVSDIHIRPQVTVDIYNIFNQHVDTIHIEPMNVFPYVPREFDGQWDRVWGIGPYTAKFTMSYGEQGKVSMARATFWLIPYTIVIAVTAGILILITLVLIIRSALRRRQAAERARVKVLEERLAELETDTTRHHEE